MKEHQGIGVAASRARHLYAGAAVAAALALAGCLTLPPQKVMEYESKPYSASEFVQVKDGLKVELIGGPAIVGNSNPLPPEFVRSAIKCDSSGKPLYGSGDPRIVNPADGGRPKLAVPLFNVAAQTEEVRILQPGMWVQKLTITNQTGHVIRLNTAVVRLFDPSGTQATPIALDEIKAYLLGSRFCPTTRDVVASLTGLSLLNREVEIVPRTSFTGFVVFRPQQPVPGVWKLAIYELPTQTNAAGQVVKTTQFEIRSVLQRYEATYETEFGKPPRLVQRTEAR